VRARNVLEQAHGQSAMSRMELQRVGRELEVSTSGRWLADAARSELAAMNNEGLLVIDAARTRPQVDELLTLGLTTLQVHLTSIDSVRRHRYDSRRLIDKDVIGPDFDSASRGELTDIGGLADGADLILDTSELDPESMVRTLKTLLVNAGLDLHGSR
jgi:hypothetical protein